MRKKLMFVFNIMFAYSALADSNLSCISNEKVHGWTGSSTYEFLSFSAKVTGKDELLGAKIDGAFVSDRRDLVPNLKYRPRSPRYQNYNRFDLLEDAWNSFHPLMAKNLLKQISPFTAYVQIFGEEGEFKETVTMSCSLN